MLPPPPFPPLSPTPPPPPREEVVGHDEGGVTGRRVGSSEGRGGGGGSPVLGAASDPSPRLARKGEGSTVREEGRGGEVWTITYLHTKTFKVSCKQIVKYLT